MFTLEGVSVFDREHPLSKMSERHVWMGLVTFQGREHPVEAYLSKALAASPPGG